MSTTDCPRCGASVDGAFCSECGARLEPPPCTACGAVPPAGARYCTACGRGLPDRRKVHPAAIIAGLGLAAVAAAFLVPRGGGDTQPLVTGPASQPAGPAAGAAPTSGGPPTLSGDMRANADGLFDRIMREYSQGDTARARFFVPMALDAYDMAGDLDADGRFHLSLVQAIGGDYAAARSTAEEILAGEPNHLLGLAAAAAAAEGAGERDAALDYHRRFLEALPTERDRALQEYVDHAPIIPDYEAAARAALGG
ncbi:MAG: zinc ribbon domain-containing protein [Gemmatimonadota bacterium]